MFHTLSPFSGQNVPSASVRVLALLIGFPQQGVGNMNGYSYHQRQCR
jgi:hypothetical protein